MTLKDNKTADDVSNKKQKTDTARLALGTWQ